MTITAEELARDKADAEEEARVWRRRPGMAEMPLLVLKYIAEVELYRVDTAVADEKAKSATGLIIRLREDVQSKDVEIARLRDERSLLSTEYERLFHQATTEVARLRQAGARIAGVANNIRLGSAHLSISDERALKDASNAWDEVVSTPTPRTSSVPGLSGTL